MPRDDSQPSNNGSPNPKFLTQISYALTVTEMEEQLSLKVDVVSSEPLTNEVHTQDSTVANVFEDLAHVVQDLLSNHQLGPLPWQPQSIVDFNASIGLVISFPDWQIYSQPSQNLLVKGMVGFKYWGLLKKEMTCALENYGAASTKQSHSTTSIARILNGYLSIGFNCED